MVGTLAPAGKCSGRKVPAGESSEIAVETAHLASVIGSARLAVVPGMGHALNSRIVDPLTRIIAAHVDAVDDATAAGRRLG